MPESLPLPKYHQIYLVLKERLAESRYEDHFPGEFALMEEFAAARVTVRHALEKLVREKLITRKPGRGTVVCKHQAGAGGAKAAMQRRSGLLDNLVHVGLGTSARVVSLETIPASGQVAEALALEPGAQVQKAVRVRSTALGPLSITVTHIPVQVCAPFSETQLSTKPILMLLEEHGLWLGRASQTISARLADAWHAQLLDVPVGSALMSVQRVVRDHTERPIQLLYGLYRPDRYHYEMNLSRVGEVDARVWISTSLNAAFQ